MSARPFAVPCRRCNQPQRYWQHVPANRSPNATPVIWPYHFYEPDTASPEYAAAKLREALGELLPMQGCIQCQELYMPCGSHGNTNNATAKAEQALALADAAGITSEAVEAVNVATRDKQ